MDLKQLDPAPSVLDIASLLKQFLRSVGTGYICSSLSFLCTYLYLASLYLCSVCTQGATSVSPAHLPSCPSGRVSCLRPKGTDSPLMVMILARNGPDPPDNPAFLYMAGYRICRAANPAENLQLVFRGQKFATTGKSLCPVLYFEESNMI